MVTEITEPIMLDSTGRDIAAAILAVRAALINDHGICYGFHVDGAESDPASKITYLRDAVGMTPAHMNYTSGKFDYGSWKDAFFMPRPCMLRYDGTVDYYLDPDDYTKREDGTASDVANVDYAGNAMMEWGRDGRQIWWKCEADADDATSGSVYIADYQVDSTFHNYNFINCKGNSVPHFYTPCFNGALDSAGRLRSISGLAPVNSKTAQAEIDAAKLNNTTDNVIWYTETYVDSQLINFLLLLMGRNTDTQTVFGNGHYTGGSSASSLLNTGTMNACGLFWGTNGTGSGVKVFGMENWWGNQWRRYAGHINASGTQKVKLTYGTEDGSTATAYNTTGNGYISLGATPGGSNGGYITNMNFSKDGMLPQTATGSNTTYYCDGLWFNNGQTDYAFRGGYCSSSWPVGALCCALSDAPSAAGWHLGAAPSCKPLA